MKRIIEPKLAQKNISKINQPTHLCILKLSLFDPLLTYFSHSTKLKSKNTHMPFCRFPLRSHQTFSPNACFLRHERTGAE